MEKFTSRALQVFLFLLALSAPLSIAATQAAWGLALLFWIVRAIFVRERPNGHVIDLAVLAFVGLTILSAVLSYEPETSIRKLVAVSLVTIVYLVSSNVRNVRTVRTLVAVLLISGTVSVGYTLAVLAIGKNLKVVSLSAVSPLRAAGVKENDTIRKADGRDIHSPDDLIRAITESFDDGVVEITVYRHELIIGYSLSFDHRSVRSDTNWLGIEEWSRGRDTRASGFFGHYTTYAEVLQLILSVAFAFFVLAPGGFFTRQRVVLSGVVLLLATGLFLTVTRASWAGFFVSAAIIVVIAASRRTLLICLALAVPIAVAGAVYLQQTRNIVLIDTESGGSTSWRMTVWREAVTVLTSNPRHLLVGVGMDSIKDRYVEWGMFDQGRLPIGHLHSTALQLAFERGIPALLAWLAWMLIYLKLLWRGLRDRTHQWPERGLLLGALAGAIGFLLSGLAHYNWGDSEVVMTFYLIMGLSLAVIRLPGMRRQT